MSHTTRLTPSAPTAPSAATTDVESPAPAAPLATPVDDVASTPPTTPASTPAPTPATATTSGGTSAPGVTASNLLRVELRKLVDTRVMRGCLVAAVVLAGAGGGGQTLRGGTSSLGDVAAMTLLFTPYVLVGMGAALATTERTHRTAVTTYALVPRRGRVWAAKAGALVVLAVVAALLGLVAAGIIAAVVPHLGLPAVTPQLEPVRFGVLAAGLVVSALIGWAWGSATGSVALTLGAFLAWPMVATIVGGFSPAAARVLDWTRPDAIYGLTDAVTAVTAGQAASGLLLWLVVPAVLGLLRLTREEIR